MIETSTYHATELNINKKYDELQLSNNNNLANEDDVLPYMKFFEEFNAKFIPKEKKTRSIVMDYCENAQSEDPFYIIDVSAVVRQMLKWKKNLPRVKPFYAMKCNPSLFIMKVVEGMGGGFDCASRQEIGAALGLNVDAASKIIFAHPCKPVSHMKYAKSVGVEMVTLDNEDELHKLKTHWPEAKIVIRIRTDDSKSICQFSSKFGADVKDCPRLIQTARELGLNIHGVSFHVGSGCYDAKLFVKALESAREVFDMAKEQGFELKLLDLGGGWPGDNTSKLSFEEIADTIRDVIDELFPADVEVIAEPGRFFASASAILVTNLVARRECNKGKESPKQVGKKSAEQDPTDFLYYINDGIYGSFNCIVFDHKHIGIKTITQEELSKRYSNGDRKQYTDVVYKSTVFGPTCDSMDKLITCDMPKLNIGDWLYFSNFGAYTNASSSPFNGFHTVTRHFIWRN